MDRNISLFENSQIIAISGSILTDKWPQKKQDEAKLACEQIGKELAKANWKLAVYTSDPMFIELPVIAGYLNSGYAKPKSIICYYPRGVEMNFPKANGVSDIYAIILDQSNDWQVSFFRSLTKVKAILLLGGGATTLTAGQLSITRGICLLSIAHFGGAAAQIWENLKLEINSVFDEEDIQTMAAIWDDNSAANCINSLNRQYQASLNRQAAKDKTDNDIKGKASKWDNYVDEHKNDRNNSVIALCFLILFLFFFIAGLVTDISGFIYPIISVLGICFAGGVGSTVRVLTPNQPKVEKMAIPVLGITVGFFFSILFIIPQLVQNAGFLIPQPKTISNTIINSLRVQYISAIVVSFLAGLAFDNSIKQLLKRGTEHIISDNKGHLNQQV